MKPIITSVSAAAFSLSASLSFISKRFLLGFFVPILCLLIYLTYMALYTTGWKFEGIGLLLGFYIALLITLGWPISLFSALGAYAGVSLSKRSEGKSIKKTDDNAF